MDADFFQYRNIHVAPGKINLAVLKAGRGEGNARRNGSPL